MHVLDAARREIDFVPLGRNAQNVVEIFDPGFGSNPPASTSSQVGTARLTPC